MKTTGAGIRRARKVAVYEQFCAVDLDLKQKGVLVASIAKNCDFEKGALRSGFGAKRYYLESEPDKQIPSALTGFGTPRMVFAVKGQTADGLAQRTVGVQTDLGGLFVYDIDGQEFVQVAEACELLKACSYRYPDGRTKMIFCATDRVIFYEPNEKVTKDFSELLAGACLFHERLFVAEKQCLKYSAPMDVENFEPSLNGGGEISFDDERGEIVWIESFGECIYLFFEYGIAKLNADGAGSEFAISNIPYNGGRILPRTVCVYEDKLVFATYEGVFVFDGKKCSKWKGFRYSPMKNRTLQVSAGCVGNRYFLYYLDETNRKRSVFVDLEDERNGGECFALYGLNESEDKALCASDLVCSYLDRDGDLPKDEKYFFRVEKCDFGSREEKSLKYLSLQGVGTCEVKVTGRSGTRKISFELGNYENLGENGQVNENGADMVGVERKIVGLKGREFSFEITLQKGCVIRKMVVEYDEIGGVK